MNNTTQPVPIEQVPGLTREGESLFFEGFPVSQMASYPFNLSALLLGIRKNTLCEEIKSGRIKPVLGRKRIAASEIERWRNNFNVRASTATEITKP